MCGIAGLLDLTNRTSEADLGRIAQQMTVALRHRGPNSCGSWVDASCGVALAHTRLAILDLSSAGSQPMTCAEGRRVLSFNGEIYNHAAIRSELEHDGRAPAWRGHSDTETVLAAIAAWGIEKALARMRGMFALAVWDKHERTLVLARDRIGEKPLYYGWLGRTFVFASELKALRCHPAWNDTIDRGALSLFMRHGYVPAPHSIYGCGRKLPPGTILRLKFGQAGEVIEPYWTLGETIARGRREPFDGSAEEAVDRLADLLGAAVAEQMIADVPVGAFLSGGIDSSTIVALMQAQSRQKVRTFTIGFDEAAHNEAEHAKAIAHHLGTDHVELYVRPKEALDTIATLPAIYDEPFADPSQLPTILLAQMAARHVKVALSGDAGDELMAGYQVYGQAQHLFDRFGRMPEPLRKAALVGLKGVPPRFWDAVLHPVLSAAGRYGRDFRPSQKIHKWTDLLARDRVSAYRQLMSCCADPADLVVGGWEPATAFDAPELQLNDAAFSEYMMAVDTVSYLPDDILVKVDRAAMAVSLETRIPLLDLRVIEFAWSLPGTLKVRDGRTKWPLRQVLYRHVPAEAVDRPKKGFSVPLAQWLRGPLRAWAEDLLSPATIRAQGLLQPKLTQWLWQRLLAGDDELTEIVWNMLILQAWLKSSAERPTLASIDASMLRCA